MLFCFLPCYQQHGFVSPFKDQDQTLMDEEQQHRDSDRRAKRKEKTRLARLAVTQVKRHLSANRHSSSPRKGTSASIRNLFH